MMTEMESTEGRRFHLLEIVGAGAFGEVYLAEQDSGAGFRRKVAIKLLHADVEKIEEAGSRMRDEARILGRLSHRNIVTVLDLVKLGARWAVVMDYVPGADLEEVARDLDRRGERMPLPAALESAAAILRALDAAFHATNDDGRALQVVHRDIKPSNVRLTNDGEIKVLDFGVARIESDDRESKTRAEGWIGTERYMSPERILCEGDTPAGDVYAAMATIMEMLLLEPLGRTPVLEERHTPFIEGRLTVLRERLVDLDEGVLDELIALLRAGLHCVPEARPNALELADDLDRMARRLPGEGLTVFARRFLPELTAALAAGRQPATGVLSESTNASMLLTPPSTVLPISGQPVPEARSRIPLLVGAGLFATVTTVVIGVVVLGGAAALWAGFGEAVAVPTPVPSEVRPSPAPDVAFPTPVPTPEAPPEPKEQEPEPRDPEPQEPVAAPQPQPAQPSPKTPVPKVEPQPGPDAPRLAKAQVSMQDASSLQVTCSGVQAHGTASVRITDFPSGLCTVTAVYLGKSFTSELTIDRARGYQCVVVNAALSCS